jgi:hypothetical protein
VDMNTTFVAATRLGAACPGVGSPVVGSPWTNLLAVGAKHALGQSPVLLAGSPAERRAAVARRAAYRPVQAPMTQLAAMSAELLPTVNVTRKQSNVHKTRINAGGYGAMGPHPEREQPA